ncbi:MAG: c-type cytochrome [Anaerolineales bacterium]|nr:c-type cytochrome [Anaerolineales bacterium]
MNSKPYLIESLIGLGATMIIAAALGLYMLNEPARITQAQTDVLNLQLDEAMTLYAENCAVCHGLNGEGISSVPALSAPALKTMPFEELQKTIARGRYQTAMPAWSMQDGGALSAYQIDELVLLVQYGDWNKTGDRVINLGLAPLVPFITDPDPALLAEIAKLPDGATLQTAVRIFAGTCVACHGADGVGTSIAPALNDLDTREKLPEDLTRTITYGNTGTLMAGWGNTLQPEEISALVTMIKRWEEIPAGTIPAPNIPIPTTQESIALGSQLFAANCSRCHGPEGQGTPRAPSLNVKSFFVDKSDQTIQQIITNGVPGTAMPTWGDRMSEVQIQAIVGFIRQWEATAPEVATITRGGGGPPWKRNNTNTNTSLFGLLPSTNTTTYTATGQTGIQQALDWRTLVLAGIILTIAFTLISSGFSALKKQKK